MNYEALDEALAYLNGDNDIIPLALDEMKLFIENTGNIILIEEKFSFKELGIKIWEAIKAALRKIKEFFLKIVRFIKRVIFKKGDSDERIGGKSAKSLADVEIPAMMQSDLEHCLKLCDDRNLYNLDVVLDQILRATKAGAENVRSKMQSMNVSYKRTGYLGQYFGEGIIMDIRRANNSIIDVLQAVKESSEFNRLKDNEYEEKDMRLINFKNLAKHYEDASKNVSKFEAGYDKAEPVLKKASENEYAKADMNLSIEFIQNAISYFKLEVQIITTFFNGIKIDVSDARKINKSAKDQADISNSYKLKSSLLKGTYIKCYVDDDAVDKFISDCMAKMRVYEQDKDWDKYKEEFKKAASALMKAARGFDTHRIPKNIGTDFNFGRLYRGAYMILPTHLKKVPVGGKHLYHYSYNTNLTELEPHAIINSGKLFCPEPCVYVHMSNIANRYHQFDKSDRMSQFYIVTDHIDYVYQDTEIPKGTAHIIRTTKPVKVEHVSEEDFRSNRG